MVYNKSYRTTYGIESKRARMRDRITAQRRAARIIAATPALKGYARSAGRYSGRFSYGSRKGELKYFDTLVNFTFDTTGEVPATGQLLTIPQGDGQSERVGRKITIKSVQMRVTVTPTLATFTGVDCVRLALVQDTQANGAAATYSGVGGVLEADQQVAFRNIDNSARFRILKDWVLPINSTGGVSGATLGGLKVLQFYKKCSIPIVYDASAATGAIGTIRSNNLFLIARSAVNDDIIGCGGYVRVRYEDS